MVVPGEAPSPTGPPGALEILYPRSSAGNTDGSNSGLIFLDVIPWGGECLAALQIPIHRSERKKHSLHWTIVRPAGSTHPSLHSCVVHCRSPRLQTWMYEVTGTSQLEGVTSKQHA